MSAQRTRLPNTLYTAEQCRALDHTAITEYGIPGFRLMQRAGHAVFAEIRRRWPEMSRLTIVCGTGNNGGDGLVVAGLAFQQGWQVQVLTLGVTPYHEQLQGEALQAWEWANALGVVTRPWSPAVEFTGELVVDAILGTGIQGEVRGAVREVIAKINACHRPVVSVDIPSGLCSDSGKCMGETVKASVTLTFIGLKQGLLTHQGPDVRGELLFDSLMVPDDLYEQIPVSGFRTDADDLSELSPARPLSAHKGHYGHVLVVGGDHGMGGAAIMAAEAALRSGSGLVSLATRSSHVSAALSRIPEVMVLGVDVSARLQSMLDRASVVVLGPGLGNGAWADQLAQKVMSSQHPSVIDADALKYLQPYRHSPTQTRARVLTPHPGEAAQLLGCSISDVQDNRFDAVRLLYERFGGVIVLKGAGTVIFDGDVVHVCTEGNPGMASGGRGDVLSGIIAGFLAQGLSPVDAARLGVYTHARSADLCALQSGQRGLRATDLFNQIKYVVNGLELGERV